MVPCVKCPITFDVLALYALTNFIDELRFKVTCIVGWIQYNSEGSCGALWLWCSWGQWGEELLCGERPLGGLLGKEQLMALLTEFLPLMELSGQAPALQIFSGILLILKPE